MPLPAVHRCDNCGATHDPSQVPLTCPTCGPRWGTLTVEYPESAYASVTRQSLSTAEGQGLWRYAGLLPVERPPADPHPTAGGTPLVPAPRLAAELGVAHAWIKDDGRNPSASYKDRASAVAVAVAQEQGAAAIACASTGNAASSLSLFAARAGLPAYIFVPENAPAAKLTQLLVYGARVIRVAGTYDQAFDLCAQACARWGWWSRNTATNPVLSEGKKTGALEVLEQLGWRAPDRISVGVGDGCILGGLHKALVDADRCGLTDRDAPRARLIGVQAAGAAPLVKAYEAGSDRPVPMEITDTQADSIDVGTPRDPLKALRAVRDTGGQLIAVSDERILDTIPRLARLTGVFAEPAAAAAVAGLFALAERGELSADERVVALVTGNGLKDVASARLAAQRAKAPVPDPVPPELDAVAAALNL